MKAVRLHGPGGAETLVYEEAPEPSPGVGEVLVRVHATAVTPTELWWSPTRQTSSGAPRRLPILGHEFSGTVEALGAEITDLARGDAVYGIIDNWFQDGAQAELVVVRREGVALKPRRIGHVEAAVVPISGLTAWQALFDRAALTTGQRVLVHGGAGGVGLFAVQLAGWRGAHVMATASAHNVAFVRELGADVAIDYHAQRFEEVTRDVDVVLDTVGGETLERSKGVLKRDGTLVSVHSNSKETPYFFYVEANRSELETITRLIDEGTVKPIVDSVLPLAHARDAFERKPRRSKVVLQVVSASV